ncbi:hypothetical protein [Streptomyces sp. NPDC096153]|uniref:hypothetical protein n=1 Tax=Streptomyces sp. NPDC096153 TaxID=3155548 RepID=UPI003316E9D9
MFRSEDVPVEDRFDCWRDMLGRTRSSDTASAHADAFWAECRLMELGPVTVWPMAALPARYRRGPAMVRRSDPELYHLSLLLDGGPGGHLRPGRPAPGRQLPPVRPRPGPGRGLPSRQGRGR